MSLLFHFTILIIPLFFSFHLNTTSNNQPRALSSKRKRNSITQPNNHITRRKRQHNSVTRPNDHSTHAERATPHTSTPPRCPPRHLQVPAPITLQVERLLREVDGAPQRRRLVHSLLVLALRVRVRHDPGARLDVEGPLALGPGPALDVSVVTVQVVRVRRGHHHGAQRQCHVHLAHEPDVAHAAAVGPAPRRLQLVDDLHRAHLGGAAHGARGERRPQHVPGGQLIQQAAGDRGADVHDVAVALHLHQLLHHHRAGLGHAAHVVAPQVHKHHMLRTLLLVRQQLLLQRLVLLRGGAAHAGARQRPVHNLAVLIRAAEDLG
mmetsp:Transcript_3243/g.7556  ORF Transcript_3243/g.7556 Transcript_3243/m.7556 type:complete len:321 (+) Transcript_3243:55-1017(+)